MYKVVICDDERIIREGLKQAISWEDYHFHEVWLAKDGIEAVVTDSRTSTRPCDYRHSYAAYGWGRTVRSD